MQFKKKKKIKKKKKKKKKKKAILGRHQTPLVFQSFEPDEKLCMID